MTQDGTGGSDSSGIDGGTAGAESVRADAGAGTAAVETGASRGAEAGSTVRGPTVSAAGSADHYLVVSDSHLGDRYANGEAFRQFLDEEVPAIDPDMLILAGDIYELQYRGLSSVLLEENGIATRLRDLQDSGTSVRLVAGNHDRRLVSIGRGMGEDAPDLPWVVGDEFHFESGDTSFVAAHGDGADPGHVDILNEWLCLLPDDLALQLEQFVSGGPPTVGESGAVAVSTHETTTVPLERTYDTPVVLTSPVTATDETPVQPRVETDAAGTVSPATDRFDLRLATWTGDHRGQETVHYVVFEAGRHVLGLDATVEAGRTVADGAFQQVTFQSAFDRTPMVLASVQTTRPATDTQSGRATRFSGLSDWRVSPAVPAVRSVTPEGFEVRLRGRDTAAPTPRTVGFLAVDVAEAMAGAVTAAQAGDGWRSHRFGRTFFADPAVLATRQDGQPVLPRQRDLDGTGVDLLFHHLDGTVASDAGKLAHLAVPGGYTFVAETSSIAPTETESVETVLEGAWADPPAVEGGDDGRPVTEPADHQFTIQTITDGMLDIYPDRFVVFGHTHTPALGDRHVNAGAWTERTTSIENTYVEIDGGDVTVWDYSPAGREQLLSD